MFGIRDFRIIVKDIGLLLMLIAVALLIPIGVGALYSDSGATVDDFLLASAIAAGFGALCYFSMGTVSEMGLKHAFAITVLFWPIASLFSCIPLYTSGIAPTFVDAYFESMSGWTTTGLTTIGMDADSFPHSINMWRGLMQFLGGIGVLLISIVVLTQARTGHESISLVASELAPGERVRPGIWSTAKTLITMFLGLLLISSIILLIAGMNPFDAVFHAMAGLCTGGFSTHGLSIAYFNSTVIELATVIVMVIGSTNFAVHLTIFSGNYREIFKNIETRTFIFFLTLFTAAGAIWLWTSTSHTATPLSTNNALNYSFYHVVSAMTTTGWTIVPGGQFPAYFSPALIFIITICMIIGGSTASTSGGLRQARVALIFKSIWWHIKKTLLPGTVVFPRSYHHIEKKTVTDSRMTDIYVFVSVYLLTIFISTLVITMYDNSLESSLFESASAMSSTGMSSGITSLTAPFGVKTMLMIDMWIGRIDILPVLMFFASFSRKFK